MRIAILAYPHCTASMIWGVLDILSFASLQEKPPGRKKGNISFEIEIVSTDGKPVRSFNNHPVIATKSITARTVYDLVYIPGFLADLSQIIEQEKKDIVWLKKQFDRGAKLAAA